MAARNLLVSKTQFDAINSWFLHELLYKNMIWLLGYLGFFLCNYVLCLFGTILNFIARFQVGGGDGKTESSCEIDGFREELTNFLFQSFEDAFEDSEIGEEKTQSSSFMEASSVVHEEKEKSEGETISPVLMEVRSEFHENEGKGGGTESSVSMEFCSDFHEDEAKKEETGSPEDGNKSEGETDCSVSMEFHSDSHENKEKKIETDGFVPEVQFDEIEKSVPKEVQFDYPEDENKSERKTESPISMDAHSDSQENQKKEGEAESSVSMEVHSDFHENDEKEKVKDSASVEVDFYLREDEKKGEEEASCVWMESNSATTTQKYQYVSGRNISGFMEEPTSMRFTFQEFFMGPNVPVISDNNAFSNSEIIIQKKESSKHPKEEEEEEEELKSAQENEYLGSNNSREGFESESFMEAKEKRAEESGKPEGKDEEEKSNQEKAHREKVEEWKKVMEELEYDEQHEWRLEWEHDDLVEQLKIELRNARQGGLSTILEEQEEEEEDDDDEEEEETEDPKETEDQKIQKNQKNEELNDQMDEIEQVYQIYEEKMKKLDILNYQTMHGLGLLQLKDPAKSRLRGVKPLISQNLWPRKEAKSPLMRLVEELQRDLELVYVGQACLSWELLSWLHRKALYLKLHHHHHHSQDDPPSAPQFNIAAGEFQLFQVLLQRFIENEAFQEGPRTLNFVKNRCVIRNLLQVPPIRDDSAKEKNITKGDEEYAVSIARLAEIIKESIWLFWKFARADKEDGSLILRISQQTRTDHRDPAISDLVKDIRAHLHKKEKKLKDLVRTGNCIVRKFQKQHHEDQLNHEQLLAQVELKLVSRVLNLSQLRKDHLIWCNEKLRRVKFVKKKVLVEPSFLLFPC